MSDDAVNACAGPFGAVYDVYIERPRLVAVVGRLLWGIDGSVIYRSMEAIRDVEAGATIIDVPCGGGVAFRALDPGKDVRYIAADLDPRMLERARRRAARRGLDRVELVEADMTSLPFADGEADLVLSISGLHMVNSPRRAIAEFARCLKPGGELVGTSFFADCSRRARALFSAGSRQGHALPPERAEVRGWLGEAGLTEVEIGPEPGFAAFRARRA